MNKAIDEYLSKFETVAYRLSDKSHIVGVEDAYDDDRNMVYISNPVEVYHENGTTYMTPWVFPSNEECVGISMDNVITSIIPDADTQLSYHRYVIKSRLDKHMSNEEVNIIMDLLFNPPVDNLDSGINNSNVYDPYKGLEWRKYYNN